jgi:alpha-tubulin suppressor-like RCC1 family protein
MLFIRRFGGYFGVALLAVFLPMDALAFEPNSAHPGFTSSVKASPTPKAPKNHAINHAFKASFTKRNVARVPTSIAQAGTPIGGAWTSKGPSPLVDERCCDPGFPGGIGNWTANYGNASGRVTSMVADPTNPSVIYVGAAGGGVWKTVNSGSTWTTSTDFKTSLAIGALAIDPTGKVIYAGTGESNYCNDCQAGRGILKSTDAGVNWTEQVSSDFTGYYIGGLAVDRTTAGSSQHVLAATSNGIYMSTNGGASWSTTAVSPGEATTIIQDPTNASIFWATRTSRCFSTGSIDKSTDGGATWSTSFTAHQTTSRIGLGVGPGGVAYAAFAACPFTAPYLADIEKTTNYGGSWSSLSGASDYFSNRESDQGWYDNVVAVDPANSSNAAFGGVDVLVTKDGGLTFTNVTNSYPLPLLPGGFVHPDNHAIVFTPIARKTSALWLGNDGGVYQSNDLGGTSQSSDWINRNSNLNTLQFYSGSALSATRFLGGTQDNGTPGNLAGAAALPAWQGYHDSDGGYTAIDPSSDTIYSEYEHLMIYQGHSTLTPSSTSPYDSFTRASPCSGSYPGGPPAPDPACTEPVAWAAPFLMDPVNPRRLIAATNRVYETTVGGSPSGTVGYTNCLLNTCAWKPISGNLTSSTSPGLCTPEGSGQCISAMAIGPAGQTGTIFTGSTDGVVYRTTDDGLSWTNVTGTGLNDRSITGIAYNPSNIAEVWVTTSSTTSTTNGVFHTTSAGLFTTWSALTGSTEKPNSIAVDRFNPSIIYVGTDIGTMVCTSCGGTSPVSMWAPFGTGLPNVQTLAVSITRDGKNVVAWTHGRGVWTIPVLPTSCLTTTIAGGGRHSLIVDPFGYVYAWGGGTSGQLGNQTNSDSNVPVPVWTSSIPLVSSVAAGGFHSVARGTDGTVWSWGSNTSGGLGNSNYPGGTNVPVQVQGANGSGNLTGIASITAGDYNFSAATKVADGSVWTWGDNTMGQLGNNSTSNSLTPVQVKGPAAVGFLTGIVQVSAGSQHITALKGDGTVWSWGVNSFGELGNGRASPKELTPVQLAGVGGHGFLTGVIAIGTHSDTSVAVLSDGTVYAWGNNQEGELGNNTISTYSATPVKVSVLAGMSLSPSITTGGRHVLAADPSSSKAWGWGWNVYGQVGDGTQNQRLTPSPVTTTAQITEVAAGDWHSLALAADGAVWTWGYNYYGQLGNGVSGVNVNPTPAPVSTFYAAQRQAC